MDLTSGAKATATAAGAAMLAGQAAVAYGITQETLPPAIGGLSLTVTALAVLGLLAIKQWVTNTSEERNLLAEARVGLETQGADYFAAKAALENERGRLAQDMAAERARLAARLKAEREAMEQEFAERKDELIAETMEATVLMHRGGKLAPPTATAVGRLIRFPEQQPQRERSREHGVVRP